MQVRWFFFFCCLFLTDSTAFAWCHSQKLTKRYYRSYLLENVLKDHRIDYCLQIEDQNFKESSIDLQLRIVLVLWLEQVSEYFLKPVLLNKVQCSSREMDLKVVVDEETFYDDVLAYQKNQKKGRHFYSLIKIATNRFLVDSHSQTKYYWKDFLTLSPSFSKKTLFDISKYHPLSVYEVAEKYDLEYLQVFQSTYRVLLHEVGHAFGLGDTYSSQVHRCDPKFKSEAHPYLAMMNSSKLFYFLEDDLIGFRKLFERAIERSRKTLLVD